MKSIIFFIMLIWSSVSIAQSTVGAPYLLPTFPIDISWHKTTLLIFPEPIRHADRGEIYVLAETIKNAENILKVKAGKRDFEQSNLQVVTAGGKVYSFTVNYKDQISGQPIDMSKVKGYAPVIFNGISLNSKQIGDLAGDVAGHSPFLTGGAFHNYGLHLATDGIYIKDDILFFQFYLHNTTKLVYEPSSVRFFIRDQKKARRTAFQDKEIEPLCIHRFGSPESERGQTIVAAFPRFTIAERKSFTIEIMENGGDRNPAVRIRQKKLLKARSLE